MIAIERALELFREHPSDVNESYLGHLGKAFLFGVRLLQAGLACITHAFLPILLIDTASCHIKKLNKELTTLLPEQKNQMRKLVFDRRNGY